MAYAIRASLTSVDASYNDIAFGTYVPTLSFTDDTGWLAVSDNAGDTVFNDGSPDGDQVVDATSDLADLGLTAGEGIRPAVMLEVTDGTNTFNLYIVVKTSSTFSASQPLNGTDFLFVGEEPLVKGTTYTFTGTYNNDADVSYAAFGGGNQLLICFGAQTRILTPQGARAIQGLNIGDQVITVDGRATRIRWINQQHVSAAQMLANPKQRPVRIASRALDGRLPHRDLWLTRHHRLLVCSPIVAEVTGKQSALIAAFRLAGLPQIDIDTPAEGITYYHLLLDRHELVLAEGAPVESLLVADQSAKTIPPALTPRSSAPGACAMPAAPIPQAKLQKHIAARHGQTGLPLLGPRWQVLQHRPPADPLPVDAPI